MKNAVSLVLLAAVVLTVSQARAGCTFENYAYFDGQVVCQFGLQMKCVDGSWTQTGDHCFDSDTKEAVHGDHEAADPADVKMKDEAQSPQEVDVP